MIERHVGGKMRKDNLTYTFLKSDKVFLENVLVNFDNNGIYYWIPYQQSPNGITTPGMQLMEIYNN